MGRKLSHELATSFDRNKNHPAALTTKKYGVGKRELLKISISRELLLMKRNSFVYVFKLVNVLIQRLSLLLYLLPKQMVIN